MFKDPMRRIDLLRTSILLAGLLSLFIRLNANGQAPPGPIMLMGGYERLENMLVWDEFVRLAGGPGKRVALIAAAGSDPEHYSRVMSTHLRRIGLEPVSVPSSVTYSSDFRTILNQPGWIEKVDCADAVLLLGGDQTRYRDFLLDPDGSDSRMLKAIRALNRRGGLIAGTSAGTAVMSSKMFVDGQLPYFMLKRGTSIDKDIGPGFGFLPSEWFVDQHFLVRGRLARTLVAMQKTGYRYALGVDEDTAIAIDGRGQARVVGHSGVLVIDASQATRDTNVDQFNWRNLHLSYLSHGDQLDLETRAVKIAPQKQYEHKPDLSGEAVTRSTVPRVYHDVFNQGSLSQVMFDLFDKSPTAVGLCLNPNARQEDKEQDGFQLRLQVSKQSVAWEAPFGPGDRFSVLDILADIKPVRVQLTYEEVNARP